MKMFNNLAKTHKTIFWFFYQDNESFFDASTPPVKKIAFQNFCDEKLLRKKKVRTKGKFGPLKQQQKMFFL